MKRARIKILNFITFDHEVEMATNGFCDDI